jgi:hypothetical protein
MQSRAISYGENNMYQIRARQIFVWTMKQSQYLKENPPLTGYVVDSVGLVYTFQSADMPDFSPPNDTENKISSIYPR